MAMPVTFDASIISNIATGITVLVGVYTIVSRSEDRLERRMGDKFGAVDQRFNAVDQRFDAMEKLFTEKLLRVEQVMDARITKLEHPHD